MSTFSLWMLIWIAATTVLAWALPRRWQVSGIAVATGVFFLWHDPVSCAWLLAAAGIGYLPRRFPRRDGRIAFAVAGVMAAVLIGYQFGRRLDAGGAEAVVIPLGLSFYALRVIHFALDAWKGTLPAATFGDFLCYLFFLPTAIAGPINRFQDFHRGLRRRRWDARHFSLGCERILYGYAMMIALGNYLVSMKLANLIIGLTAAHPGLAAYLDCVRYGLNLYAQFAGYSHIAVGFAHLLGFTVMENFHYPFLAAHPADFWRRWHISLSNWCRDYVYLPVLSVTRRPLPAILASMLVLGLWHELSWRYCVWGMYHGLGIAAGQAIRQHLPLPGGWAGRALAALGWLLTMNFVLLSFALTKEPDLASALAVYRAIFNW